MDHLSASVPTWPSVAPIPPSSVPELGNIAKHNPTETVNQGSPKLQQKTTANAATAGGSPVAASSAEEVRAKDVNPYGHTLVEFEIELNDLAASEETQEVQMLQLYEDKFSKVRV